MEYLMSFYIKFTNESVSERMLKNNDSRQSYGQDYSGYFSTHSYSHSYTLHSSAAADTVMNFRLHG